jgi:hypothetical protein
MKSENQSLSDAVRKHCKECSGGSVKEVRLCPATECFLWRFRFGKKPAAVIRERGSSFSPYLRKRNFREDGVFGPDKEASFCEGLRNGRFSKKNPCFSGVFSKNPEFPVGMVHQKEQQEKPVEKTDTAKRDN